MDPDGQVSMRKVTLDPKRLNKDLFIDLRNIGVSFLDMFGDQEDVTVIGLKT